MPELTANLVDLSLGRTFTTRGRGWAPLRARRRSGQGCPIDWGITATEPRHHRTTSAD